MAKTIRGRWFRFLLGPLLAASLSQAAPQQRPPVELLARGIKAAQQQRYEEALNNLRAARQRLPQLADYASYWLGWVEFQRKNYIEAVRALAGVWQVSLASPLAGKAALLAARAHLENGSPAEAVALLRARREELPQPEGELLLATALEKAGELVAAASSYQRIYYGYPASGEAQEAEKALARLRLKLGDRYPQPSPKQMLERAEHWLRTREYRKARAEFQALQKQLGGRERDLARVRVGAAFYYDYDTTAAWDYLRSLEVSDPEADAERLYYLVECARRLEREAEMQSLLERLGQLYRRSSWRLKALVSAGNRYLLENQREKFEPLFRACYEDFPAEPQAAYCHWKVAWSWYLARRPEAAQALRRHLEKYPASEQAPAALYFLGRLAEEADSRGAARAWYEALVVRFPNYYFATLARDRLRRPALATAAPLREVVEYVSKLAWPERAAADGFEPGPITRLRLERARLLHAARLEEASFEELRFGARREEQPHVVILELARLMSGREPPHRILQAAKQLVPAYLSFGREEAPKRFWQVLFPFPYRTAIESHARKQRLDPFLVAGLIRQESEFNPGAVSPARAYGLMQILPSQGRLLARQLRLRYRTSLLFQPATNLRLGTYYLRTLLDKYGGNLEAALAAYNAGPNRVDRWLEWADFREPAEFVETIPITETRTYVRAVLRNADFYRWLYGPAARSPAPSKTTRKPAR